MLIMQPYPEDQMEENPPQNRVNPNKSSQFQKKMRLTNVLLAFQLLDIRRNCHLFVN